MSKTTLSAIQEAELKLKKEEGDSEGYHAVFDELLESRLQELDPKFMQAMDALYSDSGEQRWYA